MNVFKVKLLVAVYGSENLDEVYEAIDTVDERVYAGKVPYPIRVDLDYDGKGFSKEDSDDGYRYYCRSEVEVVS